MTDRMDALAPTPPNKDGKSFLRRIGVAWPMKNGTGYRVVLDASPLPILNDKGQIETVILLMPPKDDNRSSGGADPDAPF